MKNSLLALAVVLWGCSAAWAGGLPVVIPVSLDGSQEVGSGDPTGFGNGTITLVGYPLEASDHNM